MLPRLILPVVIALTFTSLEAQQTTSPAPPANPPTLAATEPTLAWQDVTEWGVEGRAWTEMERQRWFDRLPSAAQAKVTDKVWNLSHDSAGMVVRFKTDATAIWANYVLRSERMASPNMTAIGASGIDLYAKDENGKWKWVGVTRPDKKQVKQSFLTDIAPGLKEYAAYLPLYNGVESLQIGVPPDAKFERVAPRTEKPIVFYGTSITHGASASRPGMVHTAILGRNLARPVINLGFSGNGKMDIGVGEFLAKIDAAVYVIDCLPNMGAAEVRQKCPPLVKLLKAARPEVPIVLVEDRRYANTWIRPGRQKFHDENHAALRESYEALKNEGVSKLYYIPGDALIGDDTEGTTDGSHPNDLGFVRQAAVFEPVLRETLQH
ncbi:SGNH/GDSL hydrolase family protein [Verrucomicrobiota bacterium sgz303538]